MFSLPFHLLTNTSYFFILAIVANAAMNMGVQISIHLEVRLGNHVIVPFSLFCLDSIWQLTFKKPPLQSFGVVLKKNIHNYLKRLFKFSSIFQLHICVRMDFLHILQPKQHITTD